MTTQTDLARRLQNLCALWVESVARDVPQTSECQELFAQWKTSVELANKYKGDERASTYMVECGDLLLAAIHKTHLRNFAQ